MNLKYTELSDDILLDQTHTTAKQEQQMTLALLDYLLEVDRRRVFAVRGYRSLFQYAVEELGYSSGQASERINAMRLMRDQPQVRTQVEECTLTLTSAAQIQRFVQAEKKLGAPVTQEQTVSLIQQCQKKPTREVERILLSTASAPVAFAMKERTRAISQDRTELKFSIGEKTEKKLERVKNILGDLTIEELFDRALEALTEREEKKRGIIQNATSSIGSARAPARGKRSGDQKSVILSPKAAQSRFIPIDFKRKLHARSGGRCEYVDQKTGRRCDSRFRLQIDHRTPLALGGKTEFQNLRHLCFQHNARSAIEARLTIPQSIRSSDK